MMFKSEFIIQAMDCPSEERMIRMKLENAEGILKLDFDIPRRGLAVFHTSDNVDIIKSLLDELDMGTSLTASHRTDEKFSHDAKHLERKVLWWVLGINFSFFILELSTGLISWSMGLVADSLDMLADSFVYGLSLMAVGRALSRKKRIAKLSGYFQIVLALLGFGEVLRRFFEFEDIPDFRIMIIISIFALIGNLVCLYLFQKAKSDEVHMKASWIFTSNDVLVNLGVILAAILIIFTNSNLPDLIVGTLVFGLVLRGAFSILKLAK